MELAGRERQELTEVRARLAFIGEYLQAHGLPDLEVSPLVWYRLLAGLKEIQGNANHDISRVALVMARAHLMARLSMRPYDALAKHQSTPGLDIDELTLTGERVIGEVKTTSPCGANGDLGANQKKSFRDDFEKLITTDARFKFFFVTEVTTFALMKRKYAKEIPGVHVVQLITGEEHTALA